MKEFNDIVSDFQSGKLDRRAVVKQLLALGCSAPVAYSMLGITVLTPSEALATPDRMKELRSLADSLTKLVSSPEVVQVIETASKLDDKREAAHLVTKEVYRPELMSKAGLDTDHLRTSLRIFEVDDGRQQPRNLGAVRAAGSHWTAKFEVNGPSRLTDLEFSQALADDDIAREAYRKGEIDAGALDQPDRRGICVSYGHDLCITAGIP